MFVSQMLRQVVTDDLETKRLLWDSQNDDTIQAFNEVAGRKMIIEGRVLRSYPEY